MSTPLLIEGLNEATATPVFILAHGAGANMETPFMDYFATRLKADAIATIRFEFSYMASRRVDGKKRPPPRAEKLIPEYHAIIDKVQQEYPGRKIFIGGKSMGGRVASMIATERTDIAGVICLGYPFHAPGKPENLRIAHFADIPVPLLICQGQRDTFGGHDLVSVLSLPHHVDIHWAPDGNHDLVPRKKTGITANDNWDKAASRMVHFMSQPPMQAQGNSG